MRSATAILQEHGHGDFRRLQRRKGHKPGVLALALFERFFVVFLALGDFYHLSRAGLPGHAVGNVLPNVGPSRPILSKALIPSMDHRFHGFNNSGVVRLRELIEQRQGRRRELREPCVAGHEKTGPNGAAAVGQGGRHRRELERRYQ